MDVEQRLRQEFQARTATLPHPVDLADRAIASAAAVRRRRALMITSAAVVVAVLALAVALLPAPQSHPVNPAEMPEELSGLPVGAPPRLAVYGPRTLRLPDGTQTSVGADTIQHAERAAGGWVVLTPYPGLGDSLRVMRDDGTTTFAVDGVASFALTRDRRRIAVHSHNEDANLLEVFELPGGQRVAETLLPEEPRGGPVVSGWTGSLVVLTGSAPTSDAVTTDVWEPAKGPYRPTPVEQPRIVGAAASPGQLLGLEPGATEPEACLLRLDFATGRAPTGRWCDAGLRFGEALPWLSPDGTWLVVWHHQLAEELVAVDLSTSPTVSLRTTLPLPQGVNPIGVWWEDAGTVLVRVNPNGEPPAWDRMDLVRCRLDGSECELAPAPQVDGGEPIGVAPN